MRRGERGAGREERKEKEGEEEKAGECVFLGLSQQQIHSRALGVFVCICVYTCLLMCACMRVYVCVHVQRG